MTQPTPKLTLILKLQEDDDDDIPLSVDAIQIATTEELVTGLETPRPSSSAVSEDRTTSNRRRRGKRRHTI